MANPTVDSSPITYRPQAFGISPDVQRAVEDAQIFVSYIAWEDRISIDEEILQVLIDSKYLIDAGQWSAKAELTFWVTFDKLAEQVAPVTVESLKSTLPWLGTSDPHPEPKPTKAAIAVKQYRQLTYISLAFLLIFQLYTLFGMDLVSNLETLFQKRNLAVEKIEQIKLLDKDNTSEARLEGKTRSQWESDSAILNQQLDANYEHLVNWNKIWMLFQEFTGKVTPYSTFKYHKMLIQTLDQRGDIYPEASSQEILDWYDIYENDMNPGPLNAASTDPNEAIRFAKLPREIKIALDEIYIKWRYDQARNRFFLNQLSAQFVLNALQTYCLPLLYGLLGAMIFVLRSLSTEIRTVTYSSDSEIRFRLRLSLGSLAGLIIGWFFQPEEGAAAASLGPMAVSFLVGYNVDILFSIMDKLATGISASVKGGSPAAKTNNSDNPDSSSSKASETENTKSS